MFRKLISCSYAVYDNSVNAIDDITSKKYTLSLEKHSLTEYTLDGTNVTALIYWRLNAL